MELAFNPGDPHRQQACATTGHGFDRTFIQAQHTFRVCGVERPELPCGKFPAWSCVEHGAHLAVVECGVDVLRCSEQHRHAAARRQASRRHLRSHAASAENAAVAGLDGFEVLAGSDFVDTHCPRLSRVAVIERIHVGEQHQRVRGDQRSDDRRQSVIITKPHLRGGNRVVFVDDRHRTHLTQPLECALRVAGALTRTGIGLGQQHLASRPAVARKRGAPHLSQVNLADRGCGLLRRQITRARLQPERDHAGGDRTGGHDNHVGTAGDACFDGVDDAVDFCWGYLPGVVDKRTGA